MLSLLGRPGSRRSPGPQFAVSVTGCSRGDRQLNRALDVTAITRARLVPTTREYSQRRIEQGKSHPRRSAASNVGCYSAQHSFLY
jgi:hypothetical protein